MTASARLAAARVVGVLFTACVSAALVAPAMATPPGRNGLIIWQRSFNEPHLWVANADGSGPHRVFANAANRWEYEGAFSPTDPDLVFFTRFGGGSSHDIYSGSLATGAVTRLLPGSSSDVAPTVSPDGMRIAYYATARRPILAPARAERIHVMNVDGTGDVALTPRNRHSVDPDWSPDGTRLVYSEYRINAGSQAIDRLVVINADGSGRRPLTAFGGPTEFNPKWMPDGRTIVFERLRGGTLSDIATISVRGGKAKPILAARAWETNPVPSPDGTRIVFTSDRDRSDRRRGDYSERFARTMEIYTMAVDGSDIERLTRNSRPDLWPDWQRLP